MPFAVAMFYMFAGFLLASALGVIVARQAVHSVFFLILSFVNAAALFVLSGAEFLGMVLVIVYVGAVAVLFLFVVMMLGVSNISPASKTIYQRVAPVVGLLFGTSLAITVSRWEFFPQHLNGYPQTLPSARGVKALGNILYTQYIMPFQMAGFILLVAMMGAIFLTLRKRNDQKKQNTWDQMDQQKEKTLTLSHAPLREGIFYDR